MHSPSVRRRPPEEEEDVVVRAKLASLRPRLTFAFGRAPISKSSGSFDPADRILARISFVPSSPSEPRERGNRDCRLTRPAGKTPRSSFNG